MQQTAHFLLSRAITIEMTLKNMLTNEHISINENIIMHPLCEKISRRGGNIISSFNRFRGIAKEATVFNHLCQ